MKIFEQDSGVIETSDVIVPNSSWNYIIRVSLGKKILVQFDEYVPLNNNFSVSTFRFFDNIDNGNENFTFPTLRIPKPFITMSNFLRIEFTSGPYATYLKLKAKFIAVDGTNKTTCNVNEYQCRLSGMCVPQETLCDTTYQCDDWTDELYCRKLLS